MCLEERRRSRGREKRREGGGRSLELVRYILQRDRGGIGGERVWRKRGGGKGKGIGVSGDRNPFARAASGFIRSRADSNPLSTPAMLSCSAWVSLSLWLSFASEAKAESARGRRDAVTDGAVGGCGRWGHVIASCDSVLWAAKRGRLPCTLRVGADSRASPLRPHARHQPLHYPSARQRARGL